MQEQRVQTDAEERSRRIRQRIINAIELLRQQFDDAQHRIQEKEDFVQRRLQLLQADGVKAHNLNMLTVERAEREMRKRIAAAAFAAGKDQVSRIYEVGAQDASPFGAVGLAAAERLAVQDAGRRAAFEVDNVANSVNMRQTNAINAAHMTSERLFHASK
jgi:TolA-binding protein